MKKTNIKMIVISIVSIIGGIILGIMLRSWKEIVWSQLDYGSLADWFSGLGTIITIVISVIVFFMSNRASLKINILFKNGGTQLEFSVINTGRQNGIFQYWGIKDKKHLNSRTEKSFIRLVGNNKLDNDFKFTSLNPGDSSKPIVLESRNIYKRLGFKENQFNGDLDFIIAIVDGNHYMYEKTIKVRNGVMYKSEDNIRPHKISV